MGTLNVNIPRFFGRCTPILDASARPALSPRSPGLCGRRLAPAKRPSPAASLASHTAIPPRGNDLPFQRHIAV
jgi:hypothetical protein